jgi:hypothetical protein
MEEILTSCTSQVGDGKRGPYGYGESIPLMVNAEGLADGGVFGEEAWGIDDLRWCMNDPDFANIFNMGMSSALAQ